MKLTWNSRTRYKTSNSVVVKHFDALGGPVNGDWVTDVSLSVDLI